MTLVDPTTLRVRAYDGGPCHNDNLANLDRRLVRIWSEDDARPPDREMAEDAYARIFGHPKDERRRVAVFDGGDYGFSVYECGRVWGWSFEGGFVGIIATVCLS